MTTTNVDRLVEELQAERRRLFDQHTTIGEDRFLREFIDGDFLRSKITSALSQARQEGREEALKLALELVEKNDPNVEMGRMTNPHYWGNCLRRELQAALTTEGK